MSELLRALAISSQASQIALDQSGRIPYPVLSIATNNNDPENERRIKAADPANPKLETHWLRRIAPTGVDEPLPEIGSTVIVWFIDGNPSNGWYTPVQNATNPPLQKSDPIKDYREKIPGSHTSEVGGERLQRTTITHTLSAGQDLRIELDNGSYFELTQTGLVNLRNIIGAGFTIDPAGQLTVFCTNINILPPTGSTAGASVPIDMNNANLQLVNVNNFTVEGKSVTTLGAVDTSGDTLVQKGWT